MSSITLLDGGMGQELVRRHRSATGQAPTPRWSTEVLVNAPERVTGLHADYIAAGARVLTLATYAVTPERLARDGAGADLDALQRAGFECAAAARRASPLADAVRIAASLPPLVASYHADLLPERARAQASYRRIVSVQADACDLMLCETMSSIAEASIAAGVAQESGLPVWVALCLDDASQAPVLRSGEPLIDAVRALAGTGIDALLVNCCSPEACERAMPVLAESGLPFGAYANAFRSVDALGPGGTVDALQRREDLAPDAYADAAARWVAAGASVVGGCCETDPLHIAELQRRFGDER